MELTRQKASTLNIYFRFADFHFVPIHSIFVPPPLKYFQRHVRFICPFPERWKAISKLAESYFATYGQYRSG
jgi:hypothetical protein